MAFPINPNDGDIYESVNGSAYEYASATDSWQQIVGVSNDYVLTDPTLVPQTSAKVDNMVSMTQAAYDLLTPDAATLYIIVG